MGSKRRSTRPRGRGPEAEDRSPENAAELAPSARHADAELLRLRAWFREAAPSDTVALSFAQVGSLLADFAWRDATLEEHGERQNALPAGPRDRRAKLSAEDTAEALLLYWYSYKAALGEPVLKFGAPRRAVVMIDASTPQERAAAQERAAKVKVSQAKAARKAAKELLETYPDTWPNPNALRSWLHRALEALADGDSDVSRTFLGAQLRALGAHHRLPIPDYPR